MGGWRTTSDARAFLAGCEGFLRSRPVEHTVLLSVSERIARGGADQGAALLGWWSDAGGHVAGAFVHTPPYKLLLAAPTEAAAELGPLLRASGREVTGVNAEESVATAFARGFAASATVHQRHRLHRLAELVPPDPAPPGAARAATAADRVLLQEWVRAFADEAGDPIADVAGTVEDRLAHGGFTLWENGRPVSLASSNPAIAGAVRIGPVYTPPHARRRGYGAAVTAAATAAALAAGAREVLLFTDLANPTSNAIYARLGFVPVADRVLLAFDGQAAGARLA